MSNLRKAGDMLKATLQFHQSFGGFEFAAMSHSIARRLEPSAGNEPADSSVGASSDINERVLCRERRVVSVRSLRLWDQGAGGTRGVSSRVRAHGCC